MIKENQRILNEIMQSGVPFLKISKETKIPVSRMYKWKAGDGLPKSEDTELLTEWLNDFRKVPHQKKGDKLANPVTSLQENVSHITDSMKDRIILGLVESNRKLVDNTVDLTQMAKDSWNKATVNVPQETPLTSESRFLDVLELFAEIGSGKHWASKQEALAELSKRFVGKKMSKKPVDTQSG